jgi:hypothetical protein
MRCVIKIPYFPENIISGLVVQIGGRRSKKNLAILLGGFTGAARTPT